LSSRVVVAVAVLLPAIIALGAAVLEASAQAQGFQ
jgi:hypothetical protein